VQVASRSYMPDNQKHELNVVGLQSSADLVSTTLDLLSLVSQELAWRLMKEGLIKHGETLPVQVIADASEIFNSTRTNGTMVVLKVIAFRSDAMHSLIINRCLVLKMYLT
jgi:hypothetical protein